MHLVLRMSTSPAAPFMRLFYMKFRQLCKQHGVEFKPAKGLAQKGKRWVLCPNLVCVASVM